ncbi:hypothetical protein CGRA01v4_13122 [Colletotrichum graminicola]|nr:hypothetical protein CGRA01v4_13122 [Colletotrichum graminicola]
MRLHLRLRLHCCVAPDPWPLRIHSPSFGLYQAGNLERGVFCATLPLPHLFVVTAGFTPSRLDVLKLLHRQCLCFRHRTCFSLKPCRLYTYHPSNLAHTVACVTVSL